MKILLKIFKTIFYILIFIYIMGFLLCPSPPDTRTKYYDDGKVINIIVDGKVIGTVG